VSAAQREDRIVGKLLVATPLLLDPNFFRTVVLMIEHSDEGALGLVLNRATDEPVLDHLPDWDEHLVSPRVVFIGGPVNNEVAVGLVRRPSRVPDEWSPAAHDTGLVDLAEGPAALDSMEAARVFSGYAGWVAGQLEQELRSGSWILAEADRDDAFTPVPDDLWREVLRRQPDRRSLYASFPDDPRSN
jgi:putative transcriptional regulator